MQYSVSASFFGPDYKDVVPDTIGTFDVKANSNPIDVVAVIGGMNMSILPPGGYIIKYIEGSFLVMSKVPTFLTIGGLDGLQVGWRMSRSKSWSIAPFNIDYKASDDKELARNINPSYSASIMQLEFTRPHRLQLIAPKKSAGRVKVKILRYASKYLMHKNEEQLIQENSNG